MDDKLQELLGQEEVQKLINDKATELSAEHIKKAQTEVKRSLSEKLKVNLFDEKEVETFLTSKVDKKEVETVKSDYEAKLAAANAALEEAKNKTPNVEEYEAKVKEASAKYEDVSIENALLKNNVEPNDTLKKLVMLKKQENADIDVNDIIKGVVKDFGITQTKRVGMHIDTSNMVKTGHEQAMEEILKRKQHK